jgi:phage tail sheath protein FI
MPEYLSPGVYVEEVDAGPKAIQGVGTSTTGFVGPTERGPTRPLLVTSWGDYQRWFGGLTPEKQSYLPYAVKGFFDNGGQRLFIARIHSSKAAPAAALKVPSQGANPIVLTANGRGEWGNRVFFMVRASSDRVPGSFRLTLFYYTDSPPTPLVNPVSKDPKKVRDPNRRNPNFIEDFDQLSIDPKSSMNVIKILNASSQLVVADWTDPTKPGSAPNLPQLNANNQTYADPTISALTGGNDGGANSDPIVPADFQGDETVPTDQRTGLAGLAAVKEIAILAAPDSARTEFITVRDFLVEQCEVLKDRFAVVDAQRDESNMNTLVKSTDTKYGAFYFPWIRVFNAKSDDTLTVPPSGHICGIYAQTDVDRGVFKAPANVVVQGIVTSDIGSKKPLQYTVTKGEQDILNPRGVNVIRDFRPDGRGIRVWGARTMSSDPDWKYVNVRRLFIFIEESIDQGTQWAVFEPNDEKLWSRIRQSISNFLTTQWREGALMGTTRDEAFFVICDRTTMTEDDIDNGRLICEIGIAPVRPAEFVIFRIQQKTLEATAAA